SGSKDHSDEHPRFDRELDVVDRVDGDCSLCVSAGLSIELPQQNVHLGARFGCGLAWLQTRVHADPWKVASAEPVAFFRRDVFVAIRRHRSTHRKWQPDVRHLLPHSNERRVSYADYGERFSIQLYAATNELRVAAKTSLPEAMSQDHEGITTGNTVLFGCKKASEMRAAAQRRQE